jgi:hypothetical protein
MHQLLLMFFTLKASQSSISLIKEPLTKQVNSSKILAPNTLRISYKHARLTLTWALLIKLLQMRERTL